MSNLDSSTVLICEGLNRPVRALLNTPGITYQNLIPALVRKVDDVLFRDAGEGFIRTEPLVLDRETRAQMEALNARMRHVLNACTYNPAINWGASLMWDRMGQRLDKDSVKIGLDYLGIKNGGRNHE